MATSIRTPCRPYPEDATYKTIAVTCEKCGTYECWTGYLAWEKRSGIDLNKSEHPTDPEPRR